MSSMNGQLQVTVAQLYEEIGRLTVENALLRQQLTARVEMTSVPTEEQREILTKRTRSR